MIAVGIGMSIFLIAAGAIVRYALTFDVPGIERETLGLILMVVGIIGLFISLALMFMWREDQEVPPPRRY